MKAASETGEKGNIFLQSSSHWWVFYGQKSEVLRGRREAFFIFK
jgi:hypothetical protein